MQKNDFRDIGCCWCYSTTLYAIVSFDDTEKTDFVPIKWIAEGTADSSILATLEKQHNSFKCQETVHRFVKQDGLYVKQEYYQLQV